MNPNTPQTPEEPVTPPATPETTPSPAPESPVSPDAPEAPVAPVAETPAQPVSSEPAAPGQPVTTGPTPVASDATPEATPFGAAAPSPAPKGDKKKLITIIGIAAGVVILAVIGVIAFLALNTVSKQDYEQAGTQFNEMNRSSSTLTRSVSTLSRDMSNDSDAEFDESAKAVEDAINNLKTQNEELGKLKAVRVGEGAELYKTFDEKLDAYLGYGNELLSTVKNVRPAMKVCSDSGSSADTAATMKACATALNELNDIPNAQFKTFIDTLKVEYTVIADNYAKAVDSAASSSERSAARTAVLDAQRKISTANREFTTALGDRDDELSIKDSANALADYLREQVRK